MTDTDRFFIVTGGPGSGKSTLIAALADSGLSTMPEAGRAIIRDQMAIDGNALPWRDRLAFAELMLGWEMRSHGEAATRPGPVLFDRGVPDVLGYLASCGLPAPAHMVRAARLRRYNRRVFLAPHWPAIFGADAERRQSPEEAQATFRAMADIYPAFGYEPVLLPLAPVAERVSFVCEVIGRAT